MAGAACGPEDNPEDDASFPGVAGADNPYFLFDVGCVKLAAPYLLIKNVISHLFFNLDSELL